MNMRSWCDGGEKSKRQEEGEEDERKKEATAATGSLLVFIVRLGGQFVLKKLLNSLS